MPPRKKQLERDTDAQTPEEKIRSPLARLALVLAGIFLTQLVLYGPSLVGAKILLPVDILARPGVYVPQTPEARAVVAHDIIMSDMVYQGELTRQFALEELRHGRLPIWTPYEFCGAPNYRIPLCPAWLLNYLIKSPIVLAWSQVLLSMVAGVGAYFYCRRALRVSFWPAAIVAWCFPISGTFIVWQGCGSPPVVAWLPWMLLTIEQAIRRPRSSSGPLLALVTAVTVLSGAPDIAGQVLLISGLYFVWRFIARWKDADFRTGAMRAFANVAGGWTIGLLLAMPMLMPMLEYSGTGIRMMARETGAEERPPVGLSELPQVVLPEMYGLTQSNSVRIINGNRPESSAGAYAGLLAALLAAPLAWQSRRHRSLLIFWSLAAFLGLAWALNVPLIVDILRMPGLNKMSHNRFVFVTSFAILSMAAVGLDRLWSRNVEWRNWAWAPAGVLAVLFLWCLYRTFVLPEPLATELPDAILNKGQVLATNPSPDAILRAQSNFRRSYAVEVALCLTALAGWLLVGLGGGLPKNIGPFFGGAMLIEMLWFAWGVNPQSEPWLYYPRIPALEAIANATPGRVIGVGCLPANLARTHGLRDVRGYDAVDPRRMVQLLSLTAGNGTTVLPYSATQNLVPRMEEPKPGEIRLHPVMDLLGVRYLILRGKPQGKFHPAFVSDDYWVLENPSALPRAFVPRRVETVPDEQSQLLKMNTPSFDPRAVALVEEPITLPAECDGTATIEKEIPTQITVTAEMKTPGLVVLTDLWDTGWNASLNGNKVPILRTDHALRGIVVPAGTSRIEFRYEPASLTRGLWCAALGAISLLAWPAFGLLRRTQPS